jgi:hypothetical protein
MTTEFSRFLHEVEWELIRATSKHGPMNSLHEAYAVIKEELDETWDEIKVKSENRDLAKVRGELTQVAAMAIRAIYDCCYVVPVVPKTD